MTVSRKEIITRGARRIGGRTGSIASGTATTAVLNGLINTTGEDTAFFADRLFMLDAATEADRERLISGWADATGTATFLTRADSTYTDENYILVNREDYTLAEFRDALTKALRFARIMYRLVVPVVPNLTTYPLNTATWIEGDGDILGVAWCESPIMLHNEDFALWHDGAALAPDGWTLAGSGATISRAATGLRSPYAATVTRVGADATLYQSIQPALLQYLTRSTNIAIVPFQVGAWVVCSTANIARVGFYNGSTTTWSSYHTGNGVPQWLSTSYTPTALDTDARIVLSVNTTNGSASFHAAAMEANQMMPTADRDMGSQGYMQAEIDHTRRNTGGIPTIELPVQPGVYGQLIVYTLRPFVDMTSDASVVDDQYARMLVAGMLRFLLEANKPNQQRDRLDRIMDEESSVWRRELVKLIDLPVPTPVGRAEVWGT